MSNDERHLTDWISGFMRLTENSEPPKMFRRWTAISAVASALQRKVRLDFGTSLTFYPNLYIILVGPAAARKGTAMNFALDILSNITNIKLSANATSYQALIRRLKETNLTDHDLATGKQSYHSSMTIFSKEFTVFLGYQNRELMAALCDWYDCDRRWVYDTISRKKEEIIGVWVNMLGATTPDSIQSSLPVETIGSGLTSRIIFICEEKKEKLVTLPIQTQAEVELQQMLIEDLGKIALLSGTFGCTKNFIELWNEYSYKAESNPPFHSKNFAGYCERRRNHLIKLSMVVSASKKSNLVLTSDDLTEAINLLLAAEVKMGLVFKGLGTSDLSGLINDAIVYFNNLSTKEVPVWEFARHFEGSMDKFILDRILNTLEVMKYISIISIPGQGNIIKVLDV